MVATPHPDRLTGAPPRRAFERRWSLTVRRMRNAEVTWVLALGALAVLLGLALYRFPSGMPVSAIVVTAVIANLVLSPRTLPWFVVFVLAVIVLVVALSDTNQIDGRRIGEIIVGFAICLIILVASFRRSRLGVAGSRGESMLVDLRDRITKQAQIPRLPDNWYVEAVMRSAGGSSFAGDFMVASKSHDDRQLQVAVVDVSGKGEQAGTRSLLLSGAFGGLLAAMPADGFLPAANNYLLRQDWSEGFATAVHLAIDLETGDFQIRSAGHPPAVQLHAGSGRWGVHEADGPVLGLIEHAEFPMVTGSVQRGDALLLFTDGLVETPQRDISQGIDRLLGQAERLLRGSFEHGARRLIDRLDSANDDKALLLLHRR
ncbi:MAG: PP2C family protein-serine/threonine phosphatase [Nocardioidaceae bacterium]